MARNQKRSCIECGEAERINYRSYYCRACSKERTRLQNASAVLLGRELRAGRIKRQSCEVCGNSVVDAHHDDYAKPLDVRWLCRSHHQKHHYETRRQAQALVSIGGAS